METDLLTHLTGRLVWCVCSSMVHDQFTKLSGGHQEESQQEVCVEHVSKWLPVGSSYSFYRNETRACHAEAVLWSLLK